MKGVKIGGSVIQNYQILPTISLDVVAKSKSQSTYVESRFEDIYHVLDQRT